MSRWAFWRSDRKASATRWVVLDVEATGLDPQQDRLLAVAAVAVDLADGTPRVTLGDSFEIVVQDESTDVDKSNILVHGIGMGARRQGLPALDALQALAGWMADAPVIAFHASFDQTLLHRTARRCGVDLPGAAWVDLAPVAEVARPDVQARALDDWLGIFGIDCLARHQAAADALATAELLLRLWPSIQAQHPPAGFAGLQTLASQRRWLRPA